MHRLEWDFGWVEFVIGKKLCGTHHVHFSFTIVLLNDLPGRLREVHAKGLIIIPARKVDLQ